MAIDTGEFIRLRSAIDATTASLAEKPLAAKALSDAYTKFRPEGLRIAEARGVAEEFQRLFPQITPSQRPAVRTGIDPFQNASDANEALSLLSQLSGWLGGFVDEIQLEAQATAYATERVRQEGVT